MGKSKNECEDESEKEFKRVTKGNGNSVTNKIQREFCFVEVPMT